MTACLGGTCHRAASATQGLVALSSAEAGFYAAARAARMTLGLQRLLRDQGLATLRPDIRTDASASQAMASRRGAGRIKHLGTSAIWLQAAVTRKGIKMTRVAGQDNPADLGAKPLARPRMKTLLSKLCYGYRGGRHRLALDVQTGA